MNKRQLVVAWAMAVLISVDIFVCTPAIFPILLIGGLTLYMLKNQPFPLTKLFIFSVIIISIGWLVLSIHILSICKPYHHLWIEGKTSGIRGAKSTLITGSKSTPIIGSKSTIIAGAKSTTIKGAKSREITGAK